jgi:dihydroflavonol-4-reductase
MITKSAKVLVTGGNGFLGSRTVHQLAIRGYQIRCLLRKQSNTNRIRSLSYEAFLGDIRNQKSLVDASRNCDAMIHLAGVSSWARIREAQQANQLGSIIVEGTRNVFEAARINRVSRIVYVSSCAAVNGSKEQRIFDETSQFLLFDTKLDYSIAKNRAEEVVQFYVKHHNMDAVIVNPCEVYGPNDQDLVTSENLISILNQTPAVVCSGGTSVAHVDDIARGICLALERGRTGERYILGGENLTIENLAKIVRKVANKKGPIISVPNSILLSVSQLFGKLGLKFPVPRDVLEYAVLYWFVDSSKAKRELDYKSRPASETFAEVQWLIDSKQVA